MIIHICHLLIIFVVVVQEESATSRLRPMSRVIWDLRSVIRTDTVAVSKESFGSGGSNTAAALEFLIPQPFTTHSQKLIITYRISIPTNLPQVFTPAVIYFKPNQTTVKQRGGIVCPAIGPV